MKTDKKDRIFLLKWNSIFDRGSLIIPAYDLKQVRKIFKNKIKKRKTDKDVLAWRCAKVTSIQQVYNYGRSDALMDIVDIRNGKLIKDM